MVLYDADNFYEHPSIKYLPDFDFTGLTLRFNVHYSDALQPIDSPKFNWIDWAMLDCVLSDGSKPQIRLWDHATLVDAGFPAASATLNVVAGTGGIQPYDRATLWFQNFRFLFRRSTGNPSSAEMQFFANLGKTHQITINGRVYSHTDTSVHGESSARCGIGFD